METLSKLQSQLSGKAKGTCCSWKRGHFGNFVPQNHLIFLTPFLKSNYDVALSIEAKTFWLKKQIYFTPYLSRLILDTYCRTQCVSWFFLAFLHSKNLYLQFNNTAMSAFLKHVLLNSLIQMNGLFSSLRFLKP